ncbi:hypothetical protein [Providencia vermicola]|uniref:hypothetical protein n=1 Tax=Providencia vermicola TaxID=333965 RepID=UPI0034D5F54A
MNAKYGLLLILFIAFTTSANVDYENFAVKNVYSLPNHKLVEPSSGNDLLDSIRSKESFLPANFSGHYRIYTFGCGGGALCGEVLDISSGLVVAMLPDEYLVTNHIDDLKIEFNVNSSLMYIEGNLANDNKKIKSYYSFSNGKFSIVK